MSDHAIISQKSFGDFLIAYHSLKNAFHMQKEKRPTILIGRHIEPLASAVGALEDENVPISVFGGKSLSDVPAAFDIKKKGKWAAIKSIIELRRCLSPFSEDYKFVFDKIGWRERFISGSKNCISLPVGCNNIYIAYEEFLRSTGFDSKNTILKPISQARSAVIIPGSRVSTKVLSPNVQLAIYNQLIKKGISTIALILEGECINVPPLIPKKILPRSFISLIIELRKADLLVSADSLPAHLGEFYGLPTFVVTPIKNSYWLPMQAYLNHAWSTYDNLNYLTKWIDNDST